MFMAVGLCRAIFLRVYLYALGSYLSMSMPRGLLGRSDSGEIPLLRSVLKVNSSTHTAD